MFILVTLYLAAGFVLLGLWFTIRSLWRSNLYLKRLSDVKDYSAARVRLRDDARAPLFRDLDHHLIEESHRDGSKQVKLRRSVDAAEIFADERLGPGLSSSRLFQMLPGTLTGLGVLGTFVGLQLGIGGLNLTDLQKLEGSIVPLIQGCAVAFSTSVWGVVASLAFSFIEKVLEGIALWRVLKLQNRIDSLIPRYVPEEAMAELELASRGTENILKGLAVAIGDQMQQAIGRLGSEITDALANAAREGQAPIADVAAQTVATAITAELGKLKQAVEQMSEQFTSRFSTASEDLMRSVNSFQPTVTTLAATMTDVRSTVADAVGKLNAHEGVMIQMAGAAENVKQAADAFASMKGTLDSASLRNEEAAKAQHSASESNQQVATKFQGIGEKLPELRQTIEDAVKVIGSLGGPIASLQELLARLPEDQEQNEQKRTATENERSTRLLNMTNELAASVGKAAEEFAKVSGLAERLSAAATSLEGASNELAVFGEQVVTASKDQRSASTTSLAAAELSKLVAKSLEPLPSAITSLTSGLQAAGVSVKSGAEVARDSYRELITLQKQWFDGAEVAFLALRDRVQVVMTTYGDQIDRKTQDLMALWIREVTECLDGYGKQAQAIEDGIQLVQAAISKINRT